jgi:hemerythrin
MVGLYELVSRIRLIASDSVVSAAEEFVKEILRHFSEENLTVEQLQAIALSSKEHPLRHFSEVCRAELRSISRNMRLPTA